MYVRGVHIKDTEKTLLTATTAIRGTFEPKILRPFCPHAGWRVIAQVPNLCWKRHSNTISRLVLLAGMMPHCRKRSGVKISAGSVTSIDTVQRQRRRSLLSTILGYCWMRLLSCYLFVRINMTVPIHPKSVIASPYDLGSSPSTSLTRLL